VRGRVYLFTISGVSWDMTDRQRDSTVKFLYDMAKGVGLIAVVGGLVGGQATGTSVIVGFVAMVALFFILYWLEGRGEEI